MRNRLAERPLPAGWKARSLGDVVSRVTRRNAVKNENVLTISARDGLINQEEFFSRRIASTDLSPYFLLERGDFAYNKSYSAGFPVGVIRRLDRYMQGIVSPLYICFRANSPHVSSDYLAHYFRSGLLDDEIAWIAKEGARNHGLLNVCVDDLFSVPIHVPPFAEQVRIAEILDTADEAILSTERLIAKLKQANKGLLQDLLTCGIDDNGHVRDLYRPSGQFGHVVLGRHPLGWKLQCFGVLARYLNGYAFKPEDWVETGYPIIRIQNLNGSANFNYYDGPVHPDWLVLPGDLLFAWSGTRDSSFGPTIWRGPQGVLNQHILKLIQNSV